MGQLHREFVYHGLRVLCIGAALAVGAWRGALDVPTIAAALCCAMCVAALVYHAHNHRLLGLPIRELFTRVLLPTVPCWLSAGVLLLLWSALVPGSLGRWPTLALVGIFAAVHCALAALGVWVCLDRTEQGHLLTLAAPWLNRWKNRRVR